MLKIKVNIDKV